VKEAEEDTIPDLKTRVEGAKQRQAQHQASVDEVKRLKLACTKAEKEYTDATEALPANIHADLETKGIEASDLRKEIAEKLKGVKIDVLPEEAADLTDKIRSALQEREQGLALLERRADLNEKLAKAKKDEKDINTWKHDLEATQGELKTRLGAKVIGAAAPVPAK